MSTLSEKIAVMQAFERGEKIEYLDMYGRWCPVKKPSWDWYRTEYRIAKPAPKVGIHVGMLDSDGEIRFALKDSPAHKKLTLGWWKHILELDTEITLP